MNKKLIVAIIPLAFFSSAALSDGYSERGSVVLEGDTYNGGTTRDGINVEDGSYWSTTTEPDGSQYGLDSDGNSWSYDKGLDTYINHGTGEVCVGAYCN